MFFIEVIEMNQIHVCSADYSKLKQWDKRHWSDTPDTVKDRLRTYIVQGWSPTTCKPIGTKLYEFKLEQTIAQESTSKFWIHHKEITIDKAGNVVGVMNGKTIHWTEATAPTEPEPDAPAPDEKPKRKRGRPKKQTTFSPGDCCKVPSGARVFIDEALTGDRYRVTWEVGGMSDEFPGRSLTLVCKG